MKTKIFISIFTGVLFGGVTYFILKTMNDEDALFLSIWGGVLFAVLLSIALNLSAMLSSKKYAELEVSISSDIISKVNGNITIGAEVRNGNIYFCPDRIFIISLDNKPNIHEEILLSDIKYISNTNAYLYIQTKDKRDFRIITSDTKLVEETLDKMLND